MNFKNVHIYVADSLRWDYLPDTISELGVTFKTVAQSNFSAPSFATLGTGLYPVQHQVHNWGDVLAPDTPTIFELDGLHTGYRDHAEGTEATVFRILKQDEAVDLSDLKPPFLHVERNSYPHVPFGKNAPDTVQEYYNDRGNDWQQMRRDYKCGIKQSVNRFQKRLDYLEDSGLLEDTLIVFTSDHGELFGEYGTKGHGSPTCPELVYVPTVFINPQLQEEDFQINPQSEIIEHVDLVQTMLSSIGYGNALTTSGVDLFSRDRMRDWGYNHINIVRKGRKFYTAESAWDYNGGHVFAQNKTFYRFIYAISQFRDAPARENLVANPTKLIRYYIKNTELFGSPTHSESKSKENIDTFTDQLSREEGYAHGLSENEKERLKNLGYLT
ncbi:sulfatase-like hydrolase/transferase [Halegenticoccus tardaugens]|uniref:sulfatase-like hydrolase/transferase n=1 Tax=Halegenticoccus tardaugens TaxID=2071624 RepID=UPI00100BEA19|nr:sulfatase-like hydrolase/transferase [Halegenticoccus tardaugens]